MTRTTSARVAGAAFLLYIVFGLSSLALLGKATGSGAIAARLASMAEHGGYMRGAAVLNLLSGFAALVLGVTLYAITRDQDHELAMLGLVCRVTEGVIVGMAAEPPLGLLWLATAAAPDGPSAESARALGAYVTHQSSSAVIPATFFAVGSALFSWLLLRGRMVPVSLAWLGVAASVLLVVGLPLQMGDVMRGGVAMLMWLPMLVFEVALALWFLIKGVAPPRRAPAR